MSFRGPFAALAAVVLCVTLVDTADAYPTTARSGTTTVTGTYRPLDLHLQVDTDPLAPVSSFFYTPSASPGQTFALTAYLTGTFTSSYGASGTAGGWTLNLGFNSFNTTNSIKTGALTSDPILDSNVKDSNDGIDTITLGITAADRPVGTLVYTGGLSADVGTVPNYDTPSVGDMFLLYAHNAGDVFNVTVDNIANPTYFYLALAQELLHVGPYINVGPNLYDLDDGNLIGSDPLAPTLSRLNEECTTGTGRCGSVPVNQFFVSSVEGATYIPEPASLLLVGIGLVGVVMGQRRRQFRPTAA